jgi:hypothetical protein
MDDFIVTQVNRIANSLAAKEYRDYHITEATTRYVMQAMKLLTDAIERSENDTGRKSQET